MKKIIIIHENRQWLEPISKALDKTNTPFEEWFLDCEGSFDLFKAPPEALYFNRMSPSAHTRGHYRSYEYTSAILSWLEFYQSKIVNGFLPWQLENSKILQYNALRKSHIKVPQTVAVFSKTDILNAAKHLNSPFLLKHNRGGKGTGVHLFRSPEKLTDFLNSNLFIDSPDGITLIQEYIESLEPYVYRLEFINKKFVYALKMSTQDGFELCPADSCSLQNAFCPTQSTAKFTVLRDFPHKTLISAYENFLTINKIDVAGIECVIDKNGEIYTYDVNTNTNYNQTAEVREGGNSAYTDLAAFLSSAAKS